jgi:lipopolysaccharide/colanic/teichoic acid biosynthesis glycosyltransferase
LGASVAGLVVTAPLLFVCAALVRLTSGPPVLFRQVRVGRRGRPFKVFKFRTMRSGADALGSAVVIEGDQRLTRVGSFLRRTKLDELPQLLNVLLGEMSIVGPRPRVASEVDVDDPRERFVLTARPGLTSYASVHHRMEADYCARQAEPQRVHRTKLLPQKLALDCDYVESLSFPLDLRLIFLTLLLAFVPGKSLAKKIRVFGREVCPYGRAAQIVLDLVLYAGAVWLAYRLRYDVAFPDLYHTQMLLLIILLPPLRVLTNRLVGTYDMMWRYINMADAAVFALSLAPLTVILLLLRLGLPALSRTVALVEVPLSVVVLEYLTSLSGGLGLRSLRRMLYVLHHHYQPLPEANRRRVLILGAGLLGLSTVVDMRRYPHIQPVGFLDDDPTKYRRTMAGLRVLGNSENLETLCTHHKVTDLVICAKSVDRDKLWRLHQRCSDLEIKFHLLPGLDRILQEESPFSPPAEPALSLVGSNRS